MNNFIDDDFLFETGYARKLFHDYAKSLPLIDYHCHLSAKDIAENRIFDNLTQVWIEGDHYKWRAMRALGVEEEYITGHASDREKFGKWAATIPYTLMNPLYHWTHLELKRYFGVDEVLDSSNADKIYDHCNALISTPEFSVRNLLRKMNVEVVCTTDDPADDLKYHRQIAEEGFEIKILPTFRPDRFLGIEEEGFYTYLKRISTQTKVDITDFNSFLENVKRRIDYFHEHGCRLSDHGLDCACAEDFTDEELNRILNKKISGEEVSKTEILVFKSGLMYHLGKMYSEKNWTMQLHLGPIRNTNTRMLNSLGADAGVDSIGDFQQAKPLAKYLDSLEKINSLPKTILYNVNPAENEVMATMAGNFMGNTQKGKIQHGAAWWFLDQKDGIEKQLNTISNMGLVSCFVGMLTDSRSFLSFPRHEYFRRILCNYFGNAIQKKELPEDLDWTGKIIKDICYYNAKEYFNF